MDHDGTVKGSEVLGAPDVALELQRDGRSHAGRAIRRLASARLVPWLLLGLALVAALGVRMYRLDDPPLNFHATRQYRSLLIARDYYYDAMDGLPAWKRDAARIARERQGVLEPPVMEIAVAALYRLTGSERFAVPRIASSLIWLGGAVFVYLVALRMAPATAALLAAVLYLFLPFAVVASRSFQPDPLMVVLVMAAVWTLLRHAERSASCRLAVAATLAGAAIFIKPVAAFPVLISFATLETGIDGGRAMLHPRAVAFALVACVPAASFYGWGMIASGTLQQQARSSWLPALAMDPFFWRGWWANVDDVIGLPLLIAGLLGVLVCRSAPCRRLLLGLWTGYGVFCLVFSYHVATHDYYHLMLVPIVALSITPLAALVAPGLRNADGSTSITRQVGLVGVLVVALLGSAVETRARLTAPSGLEDQPRIAAEIGEHVGHSTNTVYLSSDYGLALEYHGYLAGRPWPLGSDLEWERLDGGAARDAALRFGTEYGRHAPDFFIVADQREFEQQKDLKAFLTREFPVTAVTDRYRIYDLRR